MQKTIHSRGQALFIEALRRMREDSGLTQVELAKKLGLTQSVVSKVERGERRLDVLELRQWCRATGADFVEWLRDLDRRLGRS